MPSITKQIVKEATGANDSDAAKFLPYINSAIRKYDINNDKRILAFLSQIGHESAHLRTTTEYADGSAYEGNANLGNTQVGDGKKFRGRGLIQITGRSNYNQVSKALGKDFINNPELLAQPKYAAEASAWWWKNRGLNEIADTMNVKKPLSDIKNESAFKQITKRINGGYNGLEQRKNNWISGQNAIIIFLKEHKKTVVAGAVSLILLSVTVAYYLMNRNKLTELKVA